MSCAGREAVVTHLDEMYDEAPVALGASNAGNAVEVFASPAGKSWTIVVTMPNGIACMVAAGESWERLPLLSKGLDG